MPFLGLSSFYFSYW